MASGPKASLKPAPLDRATARALTEAGYMPLSEYLRLAEAQRKHEELVALLLWLIRRSLNDPALLD
jgi:hypothetical protein